MKILIATGIYPPESGGPATYTKLLEERLPLEGFGVDVLPFRVVRHVPKILRHAAYFFKVLYVARGTDVIYAQDTVSVGLPALLASIIAHKKFMVRVPGDYAWEQGRQRFNVGDELDEFQKKHYGARVEFLRLLQRFVVRRARVIVTPSEYMKRIVQSWGARKVQRIYSSVEMPLPIEVKRPDGFFVVTIARPVPWKGLDGLKRVVERERGWTLKIVNDLPYAEAMGWVKVADVFVLNSTYEGLSHALVEAMMLGTPVVATRVGGNPELIEAGVEGLLVPPKDDEALYEALKQVEEDMVGARTRAEAAWAKTKAFNIDSTIKELTDLLKTI